MSTTTSHPVTRHELEARWRKANAIHAVIPDGHSWHALAAFSPERRAQAAAAAGEYEPSDTTWALVVELRRGSALTP